MNWGDSVTSASTGRFGLWFSAECELQSCGTSSWANNIVLSWASCSPFEWIWKASLWKCVHMKLLCAVGCAGLEQKWGKRCSHVFKFIYNYLHFPLSCSQFWEACKQTPCSNLYKRAQHLQWEMLKSLRWGGGLVRNLSHLGLIVQPLKWEKRSLCWSQCKYTRAHFSTCFTSLLEPDRAHI